jgi:hypothetical protein
VAALSGLETVAHGGAWGALAEGLIAVAIAAFFFAIWLRERRRGTDRTPAELRDEDSV